jgi:hypothetical protein
MENINWKKRGFWLTAYSLIRDILTGHPRWKNKVKKNKE